ncbi:MAG: nitroreductase/quinone reductase family protein, partial [Acidimicrobiia bacterium]
MKDASVKRWSAFHTLVYRLTGGLVGRRLADNDVLLLTTRGHITGRRHTVPLLYLRDGERLVVIASYGGRADHPSWYRNLVNEPSVEVQVEEGSRPMAARPATATERSEWWPRVVAAYQG